VNIDNILGYIKSGLGIVPEKKQFRILVSSPLIMAIMMGLIPGIVLGGFQLLLSIMMMVTSCIAMIVVFRLSEQGLTVKNRLIIQAWIASSWVLQFVLLETMYFLIIFQFSFVLCLLYTLPILIPVLLGIKASKKVKRNTPFNAKEILHGGIRVSFSMSGFVGIGIASVMFRNVSQKTAGIIMVFCFSLLASAMSIGLLSIQRLYYLLKLEKLGLLPEEFNKIDDKCKLNEKNECDKNIKFGEKPKLKEYPKHK